MTSDRSYAEAERIRGGAGGASLGAFSGAAVPAERTVRSPTLTAAAVAGLQTGFDSATGGFGRAPKFPPSMVLEFLLRHHARTGSPPRWTWPQRTCEAMAAAACTTSSAAGSRATAWTRAWVVPHFEKMLYDNALLAGAYTHWWRLTGAPLARRVAEETCDFLLRELRTAEGGFAASLDADSASAARGGRVLRVDARRAAQVLGEAGRGVRGARRSG